MARGAKCESLGQRAQVWTLDIRLCLTLKAFANSNPGFALKPWVIEQRHFVATLKELRPSLVRKKYIFIALHAHKELRCVGGPWSWSILTRHVASDGAKRVWNSELTRCCDQGMATQLLQSWELEQLTARFQG